MKEWKNEKMKEWHEMNMKRTWKWRSKWNESDNESEIEIANEMKTNTMLEKQE